MPFIGYSQLFEIDEDLDEERKEYSRKVIQARNHLLALIDQILEFSTIEADKLKFTLNEVKFRELLQECERLMQTMATKHFNLLHH